MGPGMPGGDPSVDRTSGNAEVGIDVIPVAAVLASTAAGVAAGGGLATALSAAAVSISALAPGASDAARAIPAPPPPTAGAPATLSPAAAARAGALPLAPAAALLSSGRRPPSAPGGAPPVLRTALPAPAGRTTDVAAAPASAPTLRAAAQAAGRHAADAAAAGVASAAGAGRSAGAVRVGGAASGSPCAGIGTLEQDLHGGVTNWTGGGGAVARDGAVGFIPPVPAQVLRSAATTRATLQALCQERTIAIGPDDSDQSLKNRLLRFNACSSTKAGAETQWLAVYVRRQALLHGGRLGAFQAAAAHPAGVGVDRATGPAASSRSRRAPVVPLDRPPSTLELPTPPRPSGGQTPPFARQLSPTSPMRNTPPRAGASTQEVAPSGRRSSAVHAARMMQSLLEEDAERERVMATSKQVAEVKESVTQVLTRLGNFAESQAAANTRLDEAFVGVLNGQTAVIAAASAINSSVGAGKRPSGGVQPPPKKSKSGGVAALPPSSGTAGVNSAAQGGGESVEYHCALVHNWSMPPEMLTATFLSQPLLKQLTEMVRMCHVSADHPGVFGSYGCLRLYEEGLERTAKVIRDGGTTGVIHAAKTEKMRNVVKNKADHWLKQLYWLHGLLPGALKPAAEATFEEMQTFTLSADDCEVILRTIRDGADLVGWPAGHAIRSQTKARVSTLRKLLSAMAARVKVESNVGVILTVSPFDELLRVTTENVRKKYA